MQTLQVQSLQISNVLNGQKNILVDAIDFELTAGKMTALVGESGSGKSLTALSVLKLLESRLHTSGNILFHNNEKTSNLLQISNAEIELIRGKEIAMIFQEPMTALNPMMRCGKQIDECLIQHLKLNKKDAKNRTYELLREVELFDAAVIYNKYPHQLSGGQQQRIMIAMAMSCEPKILIADEPTTALDAKVQKQIMLLIQKLQIQKNMSVLFITHDLSLVKHFAQEVLVMYKGKLVERGDVLNVLENPTHAYTKGLLACIPSFGMKGKVLPVLSDFYPEHKEVKLKTNGPLEKRGNDKPNMQIPVLEVQGLSAGYTDRSNRLFGKSKKQLAIQEINFNVQPQEIMGLIGESGSGKSTLSKTILKIVSPTSGSICLEGEKIESFSRKSYARKLQVVFQDPYGSLNPQLNIEKAISEPMMVHKIFTEEKKRKERTIELLEMVGLQAGDEKKFPHQFSGGQRQRICIARALSLNPSFIIFDESVSALDLSIQSQILNLIVELKQKIGFAALFITHNLNVVHYISDRVMVMQNGLIVEQGNTDDILRNPSASYTRQLIEEAGIV
jgi:peptide/nickel transport system ATP-binding protein